MKRKKLEMPKALRDWSRKRLAGVCGISQGCPDDPAEELRRLARCANTMASRMIRSSDVRAWSKIVSVLDSAAKKAARVRLP